MSYEQLVTIPPGYCFIPSCQSTSSSRSRTTSTTTIFGPTLTAPVPQQKRAPDTVIAKIGTETFNNFPTDAPVVVGEGPVCIVFCDWAKSQQGGEDASKPSDVPDLTPPTRPTGDTMAMVTITSIVSSTTIHLPGPAPTKTHATKPFPSQTLGYMITPTATPSTSSSHPHKFSSAEIFGIVVGALAGLALVLGVAWLITRKVRQVKARLNVRTRGVRRDREREIHEMENGVGVPEMGKHLTGEEGNKKV